MILSREVVGVYVCVFMKLYITARSDPVIYSSFYATVYNH